jgi:hypothetical protein
VPGAGNIKGRCAAKFQAKSTKGRCATKGDAKWNENSV